MAWSVIQTKLRGLQKKMSHLINLLISAAARFVTELFNHGFRVSEALGVCAEHSEPELIPFGLGYDSFGFR
jgi:hypothetical protein